MNVVTSPILHRRGQRFVDKVKTPLEGALTGFSWLCADQLAVWYDEEDIHGWEKIQIVASTDKPTGTTHTELLGYGTEYAEYVLTPSGAFEVYGAFWDWIDALPEGYRYLWIEILEKRS